LLNFEPNGYFPIASVPSQSSQDARLAVPDLGHSAISSPGSGSYVTSLQDPLVSPLPSVESTLDETFSPVPSYEIKESANASPESECAIAEAGVTIRSPLHCRACKRDQCEEITATMCGHLFCYK